jgi:hypothetical protein
MELVCCLFATHFSRYSRNSRAIPVTGPGRRPVGFSDVKDPTCLDNRLTDGAKVAGRVLLPRNIIFPLMILIFVRG